jgi:hypothetical protein
VARELKACLGRRTTAGSSKEATPASTELAPCA